jgi:hypothetical protein
MADEQTIAITSFDAFDRQAKSHHDIRDHLYAMASQFELQHQENIASKLDSQHIGTYNSWWSNVKNALLKQAQLHDYLGNQLIAARNAYITTEGEVDQLFGGKENPS